MSVKVTTQHNDIKAWLHAARPRTLPLAFSSTLLGSFLAWNHPSFKWPVLILALLTTLFLQVLSNLANDYGDSVNGMDNKHRVGPQRAVQSGSISLKSMLIGIVGTSLLTLISGILLIGYGFNFEISIAGLVFFFIGIGALSAAIKYTIGKNPYGYMGYGDLFVFIFFGLTGVLGTYYLHTGALDTILLFPASAVGFLSMAVLNLNNLRDVTGDALSGKRTLVVIMGSKRAKYYHLLLIAFAVASLIVYTFYTFESLLQWVYLITLPFFIFHLRKVFVNTVPSSLDPELRKLALATFATVILFGIFL